MSGRNLILVTLSGFVISAGPIELAQAQTGHALVLAERACLDQDVIPSTAAFDTCVVRAARAYDRGDPDGAKIEAWRTFAVQATCHSYGLTPETVGYRQCVASHAERRVAMPESEVRVYQMPRVYPAYYDDYVVGPQIAAP